ncbi:MAG: TetR/AcrR family transcriptional regulator [Psychromonas sp.]
MRDSTKKKRTRIIEVATKLFIEQGYKDTSLDQIVNICGGSKQTLYRYFGNKEGLFVEVLSHNTKNSIESVFQLSQMHESSLQVTLEGFAIQYLQGICTNPVLGLFRIVSSDFNKNSTVSTQFWETGPARIHQYMIEFLEHNLACQSLKIDNPSHACSQLLALIKLDYQNMALMGFPLPDKAQLQIHSKNAVASFLTLYQ